MTELAERRVGRYAVRPARRADADGARSVMLDTFYQVFGHGYSPRWHTDVIDMDRAYFDHPRQCLFVAALDDEVVGTAAVRADGPQSPPHPPWLAERYPSGTTAQIFRVYVRPEHRRNGLAHALVKEIHDGRTDPRYSPAVHFEIPIPLAPATVPDR